MGHRRERRAVTRAMASVGVLATIAVFAMLAVVGCARSVAPVYDAGPPVDGSRDGPTMPCDVGTVIENAPPVEQLDLLVVVDNSNSMRENQSNIGAQMRPMIEALTHPPDDDRNGLPDYPPVRDLHVGVVSTDLGTRGSMVPGCANSDVGDDGLLNPIRNGQATARHQPWASGAPPEFRPADCNRPDQFPSFITFSSGSTDIAQFSHDFICNASLYVGGCGLEQQLESAYRAIVWHDASDRPGNMDANAGFLRSTALLMILVLSDEEDGSTRDCRYAEATVGCTDATDVFVMASTGWSAPDLSMRFYMYEPCGPQDPTWPLDRYVDPRNPARGFLSVKPGHPERVLFAAITGVPLQVPTRTVGVETLTDWDALLGPPDPANRDDFCRRNGALAMDSPTHPEGPISMRQANRDIQCPNRTVPACRREGTPYDPLRPSCHPTEQYSAWPSRRLVEIARRFDESALCAGSPCRNGLVTSICRQNYRSAIDLLTRRIRYRLVQRCL